jgi:hypothetical protein
MTMGQARVRTRRRLDDNESEDTSNNTEQSDKLTRRGPMATAAGDVQGGVRPDHVDIVAIVDSLDSDDKDESSRQNEHVDMTGVSGLHSAHCGHRRLCLGRPGRPGRPGHPALGAKVTEWK